ncbi:MAG: hypothetical protein WCP23_04045 [Planctomycetota bacterium]
MRFLLRVFEYEAGSYPTADAAANGQRVAAHFATLTAESILGKVANVLTLPGVPGVRLG